VLHSYSDETATREVGTYNGVTITYDPLKNDYYANVGGVGKRCDSLTDRLEKAVATAERQAMR